MSNGAGCAIGVTGLATMGANLARNVASRGIPVAVHNRTTAKTEAFLAEHGHEGPVTGSTTAAEFVAALRRPRTVLVMVKAGAGVEAVLDELRELLEPGDIVIDGGNTYFTDTQRRAAALEGAGIHFLGVGVSGGEEGALRGPSLMPGGPREAYETVAPVLTTIAAQVDGEPCCAWLGPDGAGHYVKMVHNGIEYADMQLLGEATDLLRRVGGLAPSEIGDVYAGWADGRLGSFLVEIAADVLHRVDEATGSPFIDVIADTAEQKGTGRWTAQHALELGVPVTTISEAVLARSLSSYTDLRKRAADALPGPTAAPAAERDGLVADLEQAVYAARVVNYAQGFVQLAAASAEEHWNIDLRTVATIWRGGCIIRARLLEDVRVAYAEDAQLPDGLPNLLLAKGFRAGLGSAQDGWRNVVATAARAGVSTPVLSSALAYYDGLRSARGTAALIQGLRDNFGAHTYHRVDRDGTFHVRWAEGGREVSA